MSAETPFGGFATKQQETFYNTLLDKSIRLLVNQLIYIIEAHPSVFKIADDHDLKFCRNIKKIFRYIQQLDRQKAADPKFSRSLEPLYILFKENIQPEETVSTLTSKDSVRRQIGSRPRENQNRGPAE